MSGRRSRNKGKTGEREFAAILREHGHEDARRGRQYKGTDDSPDVVGLGDDFHLEVKRREAIRIEEWCKQVEAEAAPGSTPVVAWRRNHQPWRVTLPLTDFLRLVAEARGRV